MRTVLAILLPTTILAVGCAGNVKEVSCADKDWRNSGYETALAGKPVRTYDSLQSACEPAPGETEKRQFIDGFTHGIIEYCTYENGYKVGSANEPIRDVCPAEVRENYVRGYRNGQLEVADRVEELKRWSEEEQRTYGSQIEKQNDDRKAAYGN